MLGGGGVGRRDVIRGHHAPGAKEEGGSRRGERETMRERGRG